MPSNHVSKASCSVFLLDDKRRFCQKPCKEYKHLSSRSFIHGAHREAVFIESEAGSLFGIDLDISPAAYSLLHPHMMKRKDDYSIDIVLDGVVVAQFIKSHLPSAGRWRCSWVESQETKYYFQFASLSLSKPETETAGSEAVPQQGHELCEDKNIMENLGSIQVNIFRSKFGKPYRSSSGSTQRKPLPRTSNEMSFPEGGKFATLSNTAGLSKGEPIDHKESKPGKSKPPLTWVTQWIDPHPFLQFVFKYRSRAILEAQDIIPSPSPPPSSLAGPIADVSAPSASIPVPRPIIAAPEQTSTNLDTSNDLSSELGDSDLSSEDDAPERPDANSDVSNELDQLAEDEKDLNSGSIDVRGEENKPNPAALESKKSNKEEHDIKSKCEEVRVQSPSSGPLIGVAPNQSPTALNDSTKPSQSAVEDKKPDPEALASKNRLQEEHDTKPKCEEVRVQYANSGPLIGVAPNQSPATLNDSTKTSESAVEDKKLNLAALESNNSNKEQHDIKPKCEEVRVQSPSSAPLISVVPNQSPTALHDSTKPSQSALEEKKPNPETVKGKNSVKEHHDIKTKCEASNDFTKPSQAAVEDNKPKSQALKIEEKHDTKPQREVPMQSTSSHSLSVAPTRLDAGASDASTKLCHQILDEKIAQKPQSTSIESDVVHAKTVHPASIEIIDDDQKLKRKCTNIEAGAEKKPNSKCTQINGDEESKSKPIRIEIDCDDQHAQTVEPAPGLTMQSTSAGVGVDRTIEPETMVNKRENGCSSLAAKTEKKCLKRVIIVDDDGDENRKMNIKQKLSHVIDLTQD